MKFSAAWSAIDFENKYLRVCLACSVLALIVLSIAAYSSASRPPLVLERGCVTTVAQSGKDERTLEETISFVRIAMLQRFDSSLQPNPTMFDPSEISDRGAEQRELTAREMTQRLLVGDVRLNGSAVEIDADRVISVGNVRSAFPFPLSATIQITERTESNPYGLIVRRVFPRVSKADASK